MKKSGRWERAFSGCEAARKATQLCPQWVDCNQQEIILKIMWEPNCREAQTPDQEFSIDLQASKDLFPHLMTSDMCSQKNSSWVEFHTFLFLALKQVNGLGWVGERAQQLKKKKGTHKRVLLVNFKTQPCTEAGGKPLELWKIAREVWVMLNLNRTTPNWQPCYHYIHMIKDKQSLAPHRYL